MDTGMITLPAKSATPVPAELEPISWMCSGLVRYLEEGGRRFIIMQGLKFLLGDQPVEMDALLAINWPNPSYPTRLFFPSALGRGLNWHESAFILGKSWVTWSWSNVRADQPPLEILANHLAALR
jgi:hypothetical protein